MAQAYYPNEQVAQPGILIGISAGEDPTGAWYQFFDADPNYTFNPEENQCGNEAPDLACPDNPRLGFNTNWIVINTAAFYENGNLELLTIPRADAECSGTISSPPRFTNNAFTLACPAQTYGNNPNEPLYLIQNYEEAQGMVKVLQMTGLPSSPSTPTAYATPSLGRSNQWSYQLASVSQPGTIVPVDVSPDDRFDSCVVRNGFLWAAQTVGFPATGPTTTSNAVQWWHIGVDSNQGSLSAQRITDAIDPGIGVNSVSDMLLGFSLVNASTPLESGYVFTSHLDDDPQPMYIYQDGKPKYQSPSPVKPSEQIFRTGDYSHTVVDPLDDMTFWTTGGYSGSLLVETITHPGAYGWQSSWASLTPPQVIFEGTSEVETAAPYDPDCSAYALPATVYPPTGVQDGDVLVAVLIAGVPSEINWIGPFGPVDLPSSAWTLLPMTNVEDDYGLESQDMCGDIGSWLAVHIYSSSDPPSYTFRFNITPLENTCGYSCFTGNSVVSLYAYRGASSTFANYTAFGYANSNLSGENQVSTTAPFTAPASQELLTVFSGVDAPATQGGSMCEYFWTPTPNNATPVLTPETPLSPPNCSEYAFLAEDAWTGNNQINISGYKMVSGALIDNYLSQSLPAWQVLIPPAP